MVKMTLNNTQKGNVGQSITGIAASMAGTTPGLRAYFADCTRGKQNEKRLLFPATFLTSRVRN
jgi:hypothetical protein